MNKNDRDKPISEPEILKSINTGKTPGSDGIPTFIILLDR